MFVVQAVIGAGIADLLVTFIGWFFSMGVSFSEMLLFAIQTLPAAIFIGVSTAWIGRIKKYDWWGSTFLLAFFTTFWSYPVAAVVAIAIDLHFFSDTNVIVLRLIQDIVFFLVGWPLAFLFDGIAKVGIYVLRILGIRLFRHR